MYGHKWWLCWKISVQCGRELNFLHSDITVIILHGQIPILYNWRPYLSITPRTKHFPFCSSTTYTTAAYGSNPNVFIRLDSVGRPASAGSGSYATIASFHKLPLPLSRRSSSSPSPYATANIGSAIGSATYVTSTNGSGRYSHHIYSKPASTYLPSRVSYYASSQLTHLSQVSMEKDRRNNMDINIRP